MIFEQIRTGGDRNFAYLLGDEKAKQAAIIDPSFDPEGVLKRAGKHDLRITYIINTHGHGDHTNGNGYLKSKTDAKIVAHETASRADLHVKDGDVLELGSLELKIIHTPGHTLDGICILAEGKLMTGDTLFVGKVGGTDFGDGARQEYDSIHGKLMKLPHETEVYPGHDYGVAPVSTIDNELRTNPFILRESFEDFVHLKKNWLEYKRTHGIE